MKTKGYRVWIPSENRVEESIHVRFDESINYKTDKLTERDNNKNRVNKRIEKLPDIYDDDEEEKLKEEVDSEAKASGSNEREERENEYDNDDKRDTQRKTSISQPLNVDKEVTYRRDRIIGNKDRVYVTYYPSTNPSVRLRNIYDVKKYCEFNGYPFNENKFDFETKTKLQDINHIIDNAEI